MTVPSWKEVERYLLEILDRPAEERQDFVQGIRDQALRAAVKPYLVLESEIGEFLKTPAVEALARDLEIGQDGGEASQRDSEGRAIGPYRLVREIGRGGMSVVHLAVRREDGFERRVALKVIRSGMDRREILDRFLTERRILARLDHPGIARFFDGGTTDDGLPYFVLEHVEGTPIDEHCDLRRMTVEARVDLFLKVCTAVDYAHRNLVVHRDIKPTNLLVTATGEPKLLDFGIAKLLRSGDREPTVTQTPMLTPGYASPEQVRGDPVTTASDVYSLGVLLYRLLTGDLPHRFRVRRQDGDTGHRPLLPEEDLPRASVAVARLAAGTTRASVSSREVARYRSCTLSQLRRKLRGDLDAILATALEARPGDRYGSVEGLAEDLRRWRSGLPVQARSDSFGYRSRKLLRRHAWAVGATAAVSLLVVGLAVFALIQGVRLEREQRQTEEVAEFLVQLFDRNVFHHDVTARELLDRGAERLAASARRETVADDADTAQTAGSRVDPPGFPGSSGFQGSPGASDRLAEPVRARLLSALGRAYTSLGLYREAVPRLEEALALHREIRGPGDPRVAEALRHLARAQYLAGELEGAEESLREARRLAREADDPVAEAAVLEPLAYLATDQGRIWDAAVWGRRAVDLRREAQGDDHPATAYSRAVLARILLETGDYEAAERLLHQAVPPLRKAPAYGEELARTLYYSGALHMTVGRSELAEAELREALKLQRRLLGEEHPRLQETLSLLAGVKLGRGKLTEAASLQRRNLDALRRKLGPEHQAVAREQFNLAVILTERGELQEAERLLRENQILASKVVGEDHPRVAGATALLAQVRHERGALQEAERLYRESLAVMEKGLPAGHPEVALVRVGLARVLLDRGWTDEADELLDQALPILESRLGPDHWLVDRAQAERGAVLLARGRPQEARPLLEHMYERLLERRGEDSICTRRVQRHVERLDEML